MKKYILILFVLLFVSQSFGQTVFYSRRSATVSYLADAQAYFDTVEVRGGTITTARKDTINTFFQMLHDSLSVTNVREAFDRIWLLANQDTISALTSLANPSSTKAIGISSPTFAYNRGFAGNGSSSYINSNYNTSTNVVVYAQNLASQGFYTTTNSAISGIDMGNYDGATYNTFRIKNTTTNSYAILNSDGTGVTLEVAVSNSSGFNVLDRSSSTNIILYQAGASLGNAANTATALVNKLLYMGARNLNGTADAFTDRQYSIAFIGKHLTAAEQLKLWHCVQWYLNTLGFGI